MSIEQVRKVKCDYCLATVEGHNTGFYLVEQDVYINGNRVAPREFAYCLQLHMIMHFLLMFPSLIGDIEEYIPELRAEFLAKGVAV